MSAHGTHAAPGSPTGSLSTETWIGPADRPLFASIHTPHGGMTRGAVVICGPLGREHVTTYRGVRQLGQQLAAAGILTVRFDYAHHGDSAGTQDDPAAVAGWLASVRLAVAYARSCGAEDVTLVGLRAGALLACSTIEDLGPLHSIVLWDPVLRGRRYLREQTSLYRLAVGTDNPTDPRVSITGAVWHPDTTAAVSALSIDTDRIGAATTRPDRPGRTQLLCAVRPEEVGQKTVRELVDTLGADVLTLHRQEPFVNPPSFILTVPSESIAEVSRWIVAGHDDLERRPVSPDIRLTATVGTTADGRPITETIDRRGRYNLVTITTRVDDPTEDLDHPRTVVLQATGSEHRIGPSRLWVEAARFVAGGGVSVVRYDRRGTGDTGSVPYEEESPFASAVSRVDLLDFADHLPSAPADTMYIGMCSGSWNSAFVAAERGARAVVMINTAIWSLRKRRVPLRRAHFDAMQSSAADRTFLVLRTIRDTGRRVTEALPYRAFATLGTVGVTNNPERLLRTLARRTEHVTILLSPEDAGVFRAGRGILALAHARTNAEDRFTVVEFDRGDHTLIHRDLREENLRYISGAIDSAFDRRSQHETGTEVPSSVVADSL